MPERPLRLGTRGSPLALTQARLVADAIGRPVEIVVIRTTGDRVQDRPLAEIGGKALWTREFDEALLDGRIDMAVHSMKDVETLRPAAIAIAAVLPRADVRERLIGAASIQAIRAGGVVGTASPRRAAQLRRMRPDLTIVPFRGNVDTRLARLAAGKADATLLAAAGLERLGRAAGVPIAIDTMLPAPAQGAVGVEIRADDADTAVLLAAIDHAPTHACIRAERALLAGLGADCHSPVAALAAFGTDGLQIRAEILSGDGGLHVADAMALHAPDDAGALADRLLARAPPALAALFTGR